MNNLLIQHQLEDSRPIRTYKAKIVIKLLEDNQTLPRNERTSQVQVLREASQKTDELVQKVSMTAQLSVVISAGFIKSERNESTKY